MAPTMVSCPSVPANKHPCRERIVSISRFLRSSGMEGVFSACLQRGQLSTGASHVSDLVPLAGCSVVLYSNDSGMRDKMAGALRRGVYILGLLFQNLFDAVQRRFQSDAVPTLRGRNKKQPKRLHLWSQRLQSTAGCSLSREMLRSFPFLLSAESGVRIAVIMIVKAE